MAEFRRSKFKNRKPKKFAGRSSRPERRDSGGAGRPRRRDSSKFSRRSSDRPERTKVICDLCKKECEVPFKPTANKPVYCDDCFKKMSSKKDSGAKAKDYGKELAEINQKLDQIMKVLKIE